SKWTNRIQWVRQVLVNKGELDSPAHGVWAITAKGLARLKGAPAVPPNGKPAASANLEEIAEEYLSAFKQKVLQKLSDLDPKQFEHFAGALLRGYGFQKIVITGKSGDGGIDGHGQLKV